MSEENEGKGFYVNNRVLSLVLGVLSLLAILVTGVTAWNNVTFKVDQQEKKMAELLSVVNKLSDKIDILNEKVIGLTVSINGVKKDNQ